MGKGNEGRKLLECKYCGMRSSLSTGECPGCGHDLGLYGVIVTEFDEDTSDRGGRRRKKEKISKEEYTEWEPVNFPLKKILAVVLALVLVMGISWVIGRMYRDDDLLSGGPGETLPPAVETAPVLTEATEQTTEATFPMETTAATEATFPMETTMPTEETFPIPSTVPPTETTKPVVSGGRLMYDPAKYDSKAGYQGTCFGSDMERNSIRTITFLDTLAGAPADSWDASQDQDDSVRAWLVPAGPLYDLYIAAEGGVLAPKSCDALFAGFSNLTEIHFFGNFHTADTTSMEFLFAYCGQLVEADLSGFDTANVTSLRGLFYNCQKLERVNLGSFDTSKVTNLRSIFYDCYRLESLDLSSFDTANVTDMSYMFRTCRSLTRLNLSNFDTAQVNNMEAMFNSCLTLKDLDIRNFNTSNVKNVSWMFCGCYAKTAQDVEHLDFSQVTSYDNFMDGSNWRYLFQN